MIPLTVDEYNSLESQRTALLTQGAILQNKFYKTIFNGVFEGVGIGKVQGPPFGLIISIRAQGAQFFIHIEYAYRDDGKLTDGFLNTYIKVMSKINGRMEEILIHSASFDNVGNVDNRFTINDFSQPYFLKIIESHRNYVMKLHSEQGYMLRRNYS
jgi:hypothetical protein